MHVVSASGPTKPQSPKAGQGSSSLNSVDFAALVRRVAEVCRHQGISMPAFRSPPRIVGMGRTIRRTDDGGVVVAVAIKKRPPHAVVADVIEGVVAANRLDGVAAARLRDDLWTAVDAVTARAA